MSLIGPLSEETRSYFRVHDIAKTNHIHHLPYIGGEGGGEMLAKVESLPPPPSCR
jgi:hypothetical protein